MTEQEKINADVQRQLALQDAKFSAFVDEMRDFKTEMRDRDNQRANEIRDLRRKQEADMKEIRASINGLDTKIDGIGKHVQNLTVAAIVGMGAAVAGIGAIAVTVIYSVLR